jgi:hypothetical protein
MSRRETQASGWAVGGTILAASLMVLLGIWGVFIGIAAIVSDVVFVTTPNYTYGLDLSAWGWVHLILGVVAVLAGLALFTGATWARLVGLILAVLVAINYFLFLPFYPLWSIVVIALSVFIIWSLATTSRRDLAGY